MNGDAYLALFIAVEDGFYRALMCAIPCRSFSPARRVRVRTRLCPHGGLGVTPSPWLAYLRRENRLMYRGIRIGQLFLDRGLPVLFEHPAKVNDRTSPWFEPRAAGCASIWDVAEMVQLERAGGLRHVEFSQRELGAECFKPTRLLYSRAMHPVLGPLHGLVGPRLRADAPAVQAYGRDSRGRSRSAATAAYATALCVRAADAIALSLQRPEPGTLTPPTVTFTISATREHPRNQPPNASDR